MEEQDYRTTYELEGHNWWFVGMRRLSLALLGRSALVDSGAPILDIGCGTGIMLEHLEPLGEATGVDPSWTALEFCRKRGLERLVQARGEQLPFADESFGAVTAFGVVEHIDADREAMHEWARVLQTGGSLVLLTSAYQWMWSGHDVSNHHIRRYLTKEVRALLAEAGLEPTKVSYANSALFLPILAVRVIQKLRRGSKPAEPHKDTGEVPASANRALLWLLAIEDRVIQRSKLPFGVSVVASAVKPAS
ncbi:MAG TPA: class I SAM-dependent methyltransferase [Acidimicrobiales bacterium]|nr:class I SAM-dependent methyltransferase [Acidimicrobiales bacterium]